ncbi:hypothetical protein Tco_0036341, partial [Tanacetum coccineum]
VLNVDAVVLNVDAVVFHIMCYTFLLKCAGDEESSRDEYKVGEYVLEDLEFG